MIEFSNVKMKYKTNGAVATPEHIVEMICKQTLALNTVAKDKNGLYTPDAVSAESLSGNNFLGKPLIDGIGVLVKKIKNRHTQQLQNVEQALPGIGSDWGLNVSSAILLSDNDAKAALNSKVRGFDSAGNASNSIGAKSITVMAENVSRTSMSASAYQNEFTDVNGLLLNNKDTGISLPVVVGIQDNTATAVFINTPFCHSCYLYF